MLLHLLLTPRKASLRLSRKVCNKVADSSKNFHDAINNSSDRIKKIFTGLTLEHSLPLLTSLMHTDYYRSYQFIPDLLRTNIDTL